MPDLREQLRGCLTGRVCLVGVGNPDRGDDGLGVRLAETLASGARRVPVAGIARATGPDASSAPDLEILVADREPERYLARLRDGGYDHVLFLDAVDWGAAPGSVVLLRAGEIRAFDAQVSTHRLSVGLLAQLIEAGGTTRAWLLGVQPATLRSQARLSASIEETCAGLAGLLAEALGLAEAAV